VSEPKEERRRGELEGARVLLTGASGFFGKWVGSALDLAGAQVMPLPPKNKGYDLRNESEALQTVLSSRPDIIIHLAGTVGGIGANLGQPATFFRDNMLMGMNVIHAAAVGKVKLVTVGTPASYPASDEEGALREEMFWAGYPDPATASFGIAKKALLAMMQAYRRQYKLSFSYLIPSNLYGPEDKYKGILSSVIPSLIERFIAAREAKAPEVFCWGSGQAVRSFLYAGDAAKAVVRAASQLDQDDPVNLPGTEERTIGEIAAMIAKLVKYEGKVLWDKTKPEGRRHLVLDGTQAKDLLDWEPETRLADGLKATVEWFEQDRKE